MKMNKKGFMLAEVVIVASVVSTVLIILYISLSKISSAYDTRNKYYDIDAMYAAMAINDVLDNSYNNVNNYQKIENNKFIQFYKNEVNTSIEAYYVKSDKAILETLKNSLDSGTQSFKNYIDYLEDKIEFNEFSYLIIVKLQKNTNDDLYYYTLKVGDGNEA